MTEPAYKAELESVRAAMLARYGETNWLQKQHADLVDGVRNTLSKLLIVQHLLQVSTPEAALSRIHFYAAKENGEEPPPRIVVRWYEAEPGVRQEVWITSQWFAPEEVRGHKSHEARWASQCHQALLDELNIVLKGRTSTDGRIDKHNVFEVPREEVPNAIGDPHLWESFIELGVNV